MQPWSPNPNAPPAPKMSKWEPPAKTPPKMTKWEPPANQAAPAGMRKWEPDAVISLPPQAQNAKLSLVVSSDEIKTKLRGKLASVLAAAAETLCAFGDFATAIFDEAVRVEKQAPLAAEPNSSAAALAMPWESEGITISAVRGVLVVVASQLADLVPGDVLVNVNDWPNLGSLDDLATAWARGAAWKSHTILVQRGGATHKIELPRG